MESPEVPTSTLAPEVPQAGALQSQQPVTGTQPEAGQVPEGSLEQQPTPPEFQFELPSGSKYRTAEDLARGATEKDFTIERLKARIAGYESGTASPPIQQQAAPQAQTSAIDQSLIDELARDIAAHPDFQGASSQDIRAEAVIQAIAAQKVIDRTLGRVQSQQQAREWEAFVGNTPELQTPEAQHVYEMARMNGRPFASPQEHLMAVKAMLYDQKFGQSQTGFTGVNGAVNSAAQQNRIFNNSQAGQGVAPQVTALSPIVQSIVDQAKSAGLDSAAIERVKAAAIENERRKNER